ncbi:MAG TPA: hypothetical protein VMY06_07800 [Sedimentisphaerales bacterium]|nr:hypothetical protein [Sedimentisphaerales bacterium]
MFKNEDDFKKIVNRLNIDDKPNPGHRESLRRQMLYAFNETGEQHVPPVSSFHTLRSTIMKSPINKLAAAAAAIIITVIGIYYLIPDDSATVSLEVVPEQPATAGPELVALDIKLPRPMFVGTPQDVQVEYLEKPLGKPRPPFFAPVGTKNAAFGKPVTSTDEFPIIGKLEWITDGDKEGVDGSFVELGPFPQHVTIDLEAEHNIYAILFWHYHKEAVVYFDVVVQVADDPDFVTNVTTLFNNDIDNSLGLGVGKDMHYTETAEGKLIDAKGVKGRYVRLHSNGSTGSGVNHYIEVEVYGKAAK